MGIKHHRPFYDEDRWTCSSSPASGIHQQGMWILKLCKRLTWGLRNSLTLNSIFGPNVAESCGTSTYFLWRDDSILSYPLVAQPEFRPKFVETCIAIYSSIFDEFPSIGQTNPKSLERILRCALQIMTWSQPLPPTRRSASTKILTIHCADSLTSWVFITRRWERCLDNFVRSINDER